MKRFSRHFVRLFLALLLGTVPMIVGSVMVLLFTLPGRAVLSRVAGDRLTRGLRGHFHVGAISGSILKSINLRNVVIRDTTGALLARLPEVRAHYDLANFLAGSVVLSRIELDSPDVRITKRANGRMNYEEVLRLNEGPPGKGPGQLIEFRDVWIRNGGVVLSMPWTPPDSAKTPAAIDAALREERTHKGREINPTADGYKKVIRFVPLTAHFPKLRLSTPKREPFAFEVDTMATRVSDPQVTLTHLIAHGLTGGDTLLFTAAYAALPNTRAQGGGKISWPRGPVLFDFTFNSSKLDLKDLRWINPGLPDLQGRGKVVAKAEGDHRTAYQLSDLALTGPPGAITGKVTLVADEAKGLGFRNMDLMLQRLDLAVMKPFVPDLPFEGWLTGRTAGEGYLTDLGVDVDWLFEDAKVPGPAMSKVVMAGRVRVGGDAGLFFDKMAISSSDIDLRTVRRLAPSVPLVGRVAAAGALNGSLRDVALDGEVVHQDGARPASKVRGHLGLDTRKEEPVFDVDALLEPFAFDGIKGSYPGLNLGGVLRGPVKLRGPLARMAVDADVDGEIGHYKGKGTVILLTPRLGADSLVLDFERVDVPRLIGKGPRTNLAGHLVASGVIDSMVPPEGSIRGFLLPGTIDAVAFDSAALDLKAHDGVLKVDTVSADWEDGRLDGRGSLGWSMGHDGQLTLAFKADRLAPFDTLVTSLVGAPSDTSAVRRPLDGEATGSLLIRGSLDSLDALLGLELRDVSWHTFRSPSDSLVATWNGGPRPRASARLTFDSLSVGNWSLRNADLAAAGYVDSLGWNAGVDIGRLGRAVSTGTMRQLPLGYLVTADSLRAVLPEHNWRLLQPARALVGDSVVAISPLRLQAEDGLGEIRVVGLLPRAAGGQLIMGAQNVPVRDLYSLMQWDTTQVRGDLSLDLELTGTSANPIIRGGLAVADVGLEDFSAPFIQGSVRYEAHQLEASLDVWKTGTSVMQMETRLPLDLALTKVPRRQLPGPILFRAHSDSTDLAILEALTRAVRQVNGSLAVDAELGGTWEQPALNGFIALRDAGAYLPGLGVRYDNLDAKATLAGDSVHLDNFRLTGGKGSLEITGGLRLEKLTHPILGLTLKPRQFQAVDLRGVVTLTASGDLHLTGSPLLPVISGGITANEGSYYFADLINKRVVDLENPGDTTLIDLELIRSNRLGTSFVKRFLDSLTIRDLRVTMGESFWLRSSEANVQLDGSLSVDKLRDNYRVDGTLSTVRGNYQLRVGPVIRDFTVERGTVRYYGNPSLNADLDITAKYVVHTTDSPSSSGSEDLPVIAHVTGTMLAPKLELTTDAASNRASLTTTELVSYLMFGRGTLSTNDPSAGGADQAAVNSAMSYLSSALSSELQRTLVTDLRLPIDYIEIRPGTLNRTGSTTQTGASQVAQLAAGWRIGHQFFVTVHADVCTNQTRFYPDVEYRLSQAFRLRATLEPVTTCTDLRTGQGSYDRGRYQFGMDLIWEQEH